jgi:uncharacterized protein YidB (DUF937 family)
MLHPHYLFNEESTMNILETAVGLLSSKLGIDSASAMQGLQTLFGEQQGGLDIAALLGKFQQGGLGDIVGSWLGDGANMGIDSAAVENAFGADKVGEAASAMGVDSNTLLGGLTDVIPQLVDQASSGGNLLDAAGGLGGVADMAKKLF